MTITPEQIDIWRNVRSETQHLEFKEAKTQYNNEKIYKYCVALANEGGGYLVLGVTDKPPRKVVGSQAIQNLIDMAAKVFTAVGFRVELEEVQHPDGRVIVFQAPSRPKGTAYHYEGSYLMRSGEQLVPMSEDQLRKIFAEGQPAWLEGIAKQNMTGQDVVQLLDTQSFFDLLGLPYPTNQNGVLQRLESERLICSTNGRYSILNIGALLLAKNLSSFESIKRKAARVVVYSGDSKLQTESDITGEKGYAVGFKGLVQYVIGKIPQNEVIKNAIRKTVTLVSEVVVRELLANALIHQDMDMAGTSPVVEIYKNRVEISNPGEPIVPVDRFIDGYNSRNERLANLMRRFGICEEKGSGIDRVINEAELFQLPAPNFLVEYNRTVVVIYGPKDFSDMDRADRVRACYQHCVLQWVLRKKMTNQSLRQRFGVSERSGNSISQIISAAVNQGLIKLDPNAPDSKKYARYLPEWA
jgi:predicted HTH transcriptional regulator